MNAQPSDATTLVIRWQPPLDIHRNGVIRRYIINITELETSSLLPYITTNLSITITSLHPFYQYSYIVSTETIGLGPYSDTRIIHMPEAGTYIYFTITYWFYNWVLNMLLEANWLTINDLHLGCTMSCSLYTPADWLVCFSWSSHLGLLCHIFLYSSAPSTPPTNIRISSVTSTQFLLSWSSPPLVNQNGVIRNYTINITEVNTGRLIQITSQTTSELLESLHPYYNYSCVIAAVTVDTGPFSESVTITTLEDGMSLN